MLVLESSKFKGTLVGLLGLSRSEILSAYALPTIVNEGGRAERFVWTESARDEEEGTPVDLHIMARLLDGIVWAAGIRAEKYFSLIDVDERGEPYIVAVPKNDRHGPLAVNWIAKNKKGEYFNFGVSY